MLESLYEAVLERTLIRDGFTVERQKAISFEFEGDRFENAFRADLIVNSRLIIEVKARETNTPIYATQLLTYLRLAELPLGLVINFGMSKLMDGVKRVVNDQPPEQSPQLRVNQSPRRQSANALLGGDAPAEVLGEAFASDRLAEDQQ